MYGVDVMVKEHENILQLLGVIRSACCGILEGGQVDDQDFRNMIDFARYYADRHHHGKEEKLLFPEMLRHFGQVGVKVIQNGMMVEHDLGRLHIKELENALNRYRDAPKTIDKLNILAEAAGYANLLQRHIDKENQAVYAFAEKNLPEGVRQEIDERVREFEISTENQGVTDHHLQVLRQLLLKYPPIPV